MKAAFITILLLFSSHVWAFKIWQVDQHYSVGDMVSYNQQHYVATLWNKGNPPDESRTQWDGWVASEQDIELFEFGKHYHSGDLVYDNGALYLAKWGNVDEQPESSWYWRRLAFDSLLDISVENETEDADPKSALSILGEDRNGNQIRDSYEYAIAKQYQSQEQQRLALNVSFLYQALYQLELDESINLLEQEAIEFLNALYSWESCIDDNRSRFPLNSTPLSLHANSIYRALHYRFGQNEALRDMNTNIDLLAFSNPGSFCANYDL